METNTLYYKIIQTLKKATPFFLFFSAFCAVIFFRGCNKDTPVNETKTTIDTIFVDRVIKIPEIKEVIVYKDPVPVDIQVVGVDTIRKYSKTYTDSTGVAEVTVDDSVNGRLLRQQVNIKVKEREIKYKERIVKTTNTIKYKPDFVMSAGLTATSGIRPSVGVEIGFKNHIGLNFEVGYNTNKIWTIGVKRDIFTHYKKYK